MRVMITGGAGFIGSALIRLLAPDPTVQILNLDKLTYAGSLGSLEQVGKNQNYQFVQGDICDHALVSGILSAFQPEAIIHLAAESHVDRSIDGPGEFVNTNVVGTFTLLRAALQYWEQSPGGRREKFRFLHVSTDEVFGSLPATGLFCEDSRYDPRSPYSATKAASDHLARAWWHTYGLPVIVTNCSNNYGPFQFPEKLIPLTIIKALAGERLPVYGRGENIRDWLYVEDHARALRLVLERGVPGETYNIGGSAERRNIDVVGEICSIIDGMMGEGNSPRKELIEYVQDRPGHDLRYAMDTAKIRREVEWSPEETFSSGLLHTVKWYIDNPAWWRPLVQQQYRGERLGLR